MKKRIILLCLSVILTSKFVYGKTLYVDSQLSSNCTTGNYSIANRSCNGTDGNAYRTLAGGVGGIQSGDTLYIRAGTYNENSSTVPQFGNYTSAVLISGYASEIPVINNPDNTGATDTFSLSWYTNNLSIKNLKFTGVRNQGTNGVRGIHIGNASSSGTGTLLIENCQFDGVSHAHIKGSWNMTIRKCVFKNWGVAAFNDHAIYRTGNGNSEGSIYPVFEYNYFENTQYSGYDIGGGIHIYCNTGDHIPKNDVVRYNIFRGNMYWGVLADGQYLKIYNNTFYGMYRPIEIQGSSATGQGSDIEIKNNIAAGVISAQKVLIMFADTCYRITVQYNLTDNTPLYWANCSSCTISNNTLSTDPKFVSASPAVWADFRLASNSPCIDAGANLGTAYQNGLDPNNSVWPPTTANQNSYGAGWEIGAFVYRGVDTTAPAPPKTLSIVKN